METESRTQPTQIDEIHREVSLLRKEINDVVARAFKWTIIILAFAVVVTWFGVYIIVRGGGMKLFLPR